MSCDYYQTLGVTRDATPKQVAKAFRARARVLHPDKQPPGISEVERLRATADFQELSKAYEVISDVDKRAHYDFTLDSASSAAATSSQPAGSRDGAAEPHRRYDAGGSSQGVGSGGSGGGSSGYTRSSRFPDRSSRFPDRTQAEWDQERRRYAGDWNGVGDPGVGSSGASRAPTRMRQEHEEEEKRRHEEFEHRQKLGSHWVKPPPRGAPTKWEGWVKSAGKPAGGTSAAAQDSDDDDASSVLSFDIGIDLRDLHFDDLEPIDAQDNMGDCEVWRIKPAEQATGAAEPTTKPGSQAAEDKTGKGKKPCCMIL